MPIDALIIKKWSKLNRVIDFYIKIYVNKSIGHLDTTVTVT